LVKLPERKKKKKTVYTSHFSKNVGTAGTRLFCNDFMSPQMSAQMSAQTGCKSNLSSEK
jgi:hypothetical protein